MSNKFLIAAAAAAAVVAAVAGPVLAQSSASTTGTGSITILRPLMITKSADLAFGAVVRPATGTGTAVVSATGTRTVTGGVVALTSGATPAAAAFTVAGEGGQSISVTIPATFTMTNGSGLLTVTTSNSLAGAAGTQTLSGALAAAGTLAFTVGGSVPIADTTATGLWSGAFTVSAAYN